MEQLFFAGKAYLKINSLVKTPLHEFMPVERSGLWAPEYVCVRLRFCIWVHVTYLMPKFMDTTKPIPNHSLFLRLFFPKRIVEFIIIARTENTRTHILYLLNKPAT